MRAAVLTSLTMVAFAKNSVLNRPAVEGGHADAPAFALVRVLAGAVVLGAILGLRGGRPQAARPRRWAGALSLAVYMIGFSLAYIRLDAGLGALLLGEAVGLRVVLSAALVLGGIALALRPPAAPAGRR